MKAQELMSTPPVVVTPEDTVETAAAKMKDADVGALPVYSPEAPCGIVTDRDIAVKAVAAGKGSATQVGEVCTLNAITVQPDTDIDEVVHLMKSHRVRRLPVVQDGEVQGMISLADIVLAREDLAAETLAAVSTPSVSASSREASN
ncbi:MAG: CBS domain-containing protein [Chloroflexi bacterium]|nr:CBS domain-containing protein [Chloroflexota bacterium]